MSRRFRIDDVGTADLVVSNPADLVSGDCFSQLEAPDPEIPDTGNGFFRARLGCSEPGPKSGTVSIVPEDPSAPPYSFTVSSTVLDPDPLIQVRQGWDGALLPSGATAVLPGAFTLEMPVSAGTFLLENPGADPLCMLGSVGIVGGPCCSVWEGWSDPAEITPGGSVELPVPVYWTEPGPTAGVMRVSTSLGGVSRDGHYSAILSVKVDEPEVRVVRGWLGADATEITSGATVELPTVAAIGDSNHSAAFQVHNDGEGELCIKHVGPDIASGECFSIKSGGYPADRVGPGESSPFGIWWGETCGAGEYGATGDGRRGSGVGCRDRGAAAAAAVAAPAN